MNLDQAIELLSRPRELTHDQWREAYLAVQRDNISREFEADVAGLASGEQREEVRPSGTAAPVSMSPYSTG